MDGKDKKMQFTIQINTKAKAWILVPGGFFHVFPGLFKILLVDRNITSSLRSLHEHPSRADMDDDKWWQENLNIDDQIINPILCAIEGSLREPPTLDQFSRELNNSSIIIQQSLPNAKVLRPPQDQINSAYKICTDIYPRTKREIDFLMSVCPKLCQRTGKGKEKKLEEFIITEADRLGLYKQSLCVISALSLLYERTDGDEPLIGRRVLKANQNYSPKDAYNAVCDLHALEYLAAGLTLPTPGEKPSFGFLTRDKHLAALWVYMRFHAGQWNGGRFTGIYKPANELFPRLSEEKINELFERTKE